MSHKKPKLKTNQGYALMTVLVLGALFVALTASIGSEIVTNLSATKTRLGQSRARFAAYSGLQHALYLLRESPEFSGNLEAIQMPGSSTLSYTVEITDNRTGTEIVYASDVIPVAPGSVHCASIGVDNDQQHVSLHAVAGVLSNQKPVLNYAAFSDHSISLSGSSQTMSFNSGTCSFSLDAEGRAVPSDVASAGDLGSNRHMSLLDSSDVAGMVYRPSIASSSTEVLTPNVHLSAVLDLALPVDVPKYTTPMAYDQAPQLPSNPTSLSVSQPGQPELYSKLTLTGGASVAVDAGEYFFPQGLEIDGKIEPMTSVDDDNPIVFYVGDDVELGEQARVNLGGRSERFQLYFIDKGQPVPPKFKMGSGSQYFGVVLGSHVEGLFEGTAELFGGFLGRSVEATGQTKIYYDESLRDKELQVAGAWALSGVTEPKPESVLASSVLARNYVNSVIDGTVVYRAPIAVVATKTQNLSQ